MPLKEKQDIIKKIIIKGTIIANHFLILYVFFKPVPTKKSKVIKPAIGPIIGIIFNKKPE